MRIPHPRILFWIAVIVVAVTVIHSLPKPKSQLRVARAYPNFKLGRCDTEHTKIDDLSQKNLRSATVTLHEGGYCTRVILPPECTFGNNNSACFFEKSQNPGDYATVWCNGDPHPKPIRPEEVNYMSDPNQAVYNRGGDFYGCMGAGESTIDFLIQGQGTLTITPNRFR